MKSVSASSSSGLSRADVLKCLWKHTNIKMFFNLRSDGQILLKKQEKAAWESIELAEKMLKMDPYVDYYGCRCIKTGFSKFPKVDLTRYFASCETALSIKEIISKCFI